MPPSTPDTNLSETNTESTYQVDLESLTEQLNLLEMEQKIKMASTNTYAVMNMAGFSPVKVSKFRSLLELLLNVLWNCLDWTLELLILATTLISESQFMRSIPHRALKVRRWLTTPTSSVDTSMGIDCTLNEEFFDDLNGTRFQWKKHQVTKRVFDYGKQESVEKKYYQLGLVDTKKENVMLINDDHGILGSIVIRLNCCGISELHMSLLTPYFETYGKDKDWPELVANFMWHGLKELKDQRVVIIGLPVRVGNNSQYDAEFYQSLVKLFTKWGFVQINQKPYKNQNSNNGLIVMICRLPK